MMQPHVTEIVVATRDAIVITVLQPLLGWFFEYLWLFNISLYYCGLHAIGVCIYIYLRYNRNYVRSGSGSPGPNASGEGIEVIVTNLQWKTSWQNLKDLLKTCGPISRFVNVMHYIHYLSQSRYNDA